MMSSATKRLGSPQTTTFSPLRTPPKPPRRPPSPVHPFHPPRHLTSARRRGNTADLHLTPQAVREASAPAGTEAAAGGAAELKRLNPLAQVPVITQPHSRTAAQVTTHTNRWL